MLDLSTAESISTYRHSLDVNFYQIPANEYLNQSFSNLLMIRYNKE